MLAKLTANDRLIVPKAAAQGELRADSLPEVEIVRNTDPPAAAPAAST